MTGHVQIVGRYAVLVLFHVGTAGLGLAVTVAVARHFGAISFGQISLAQSIVMYGLIAANCGMEGYAIRNTAADPNRLSSFASTVMTMRLLLGLVAYGILLAVAALVPQLRPIIGLVALFGLTLFTQAATVLWVSKATQRTHVFGLADFMTQGLYLSVVLVAIHQSFGPRSVPAALLIAQALVAVGLMVWMVLTVGQLGRPLPRRESLRFLREASPIGGSKLIRSLALRSDLILTGLFFSMNEVGLYACAYKFFLFGVGLNALYSVILLPHLSRHAADSIQSVERELRVSLLRTLPVAAVGLGIGVLFAGHLLSWVFGTNFADARVPLQILLVALLLNLVATQYRNTLIALGRQGRDFTNVLTGTTMHIGLKLFLVPIWGITGAAFGNLLGEAIFVAFAWQATRKAFRQSDANKEVESMPSAAETQSTSNLLAPNLPDRAVVAIDGNT